MRIVYKILVFSFTYLTSTLPAFRLPAFYQKERNVDPRPEAEALLQIIISGRAAYPAVEGTKNRMAKTAAIGSDKLKTKAFQLN